jgi:hypothetical protein
MKKTIKGYLFNRIEKLGNKNFNHIGFEDDQKMFGELIATLVPEVGMKKRAKLTVELLPDNNKSKASSRLRNIEQKSSSAIS